MECLVGYGISITGSCTNLLGKYLLGTTQVGLSAMGQKPAGSDHWASPPDNDFAQVSVRYHQNEPTVPLHSSVALPSQSLCEDARLFPLKAWLCESKIVSSAVPPDYVSW